MTLLFWGLTLGIVGKVLLAVSVIMVHSKIIHEHRIDTAVLIEMRHEKTLAISAIALLVIGYFLELWAYGMIPGVAGTISF